jgi:hypothetical protein
MPTQNINEFTVWQFQTPVVNLSTDNEFDIWQNLTPDEDKDESFSSVVVTTTRRRVFEF